MRRQVLQSARAGVVGSGEWIPIRRSTHLARLPPREASRWWKLRAGKGAAGIPGSRLVGHSCVQRITWRRLGAVVPVRPAVSCY